MREFPRILMPPRASFFLLGPRGTGKSQWIRKHFCSALHLDLLDEALHQSLLGDYSLFPSLISDLKPGSWVVLDEVQRIPSLLNEVHRHIEERKLRFVLCGSSARKLKTKGVNLLAGRALSLNMHPFLPEELGEEFSIERVLRYGSLPVIWNSETLERSLLSYVQTYLSKEIQTEALVRNLPGFVRFLPVAALFHGQTLNISNIARDSEVQRTTVHGYFEILEDTLLGYRLPAYSAKLRVKEKRHPKWYWFDSGVVRAIKKQLDPVSNEEKGSLFEGWVANLFRAYASYRELYDDWFYWSSGESKRQEVDFLLRKGRKWVAIEVKCITKVRNEMVAGLKAVESLPGLQRRILVYLGNLRLKMDGNIEILPLKEFLRVLETGSLW